MVTMLLIFAFVMSLIINFGKRIVHDDEQERAPKTNEVKNRR